MAACQHVAEKCQLSYAIKEHKAFSSQKNIPQIIKVCVILTSQIRNILLWKGIKPYHRKYKRLRSRQSIGLYVVALPGIRTAWRSSISIMLGYIHLSIV
jgi:hypothetical protein